MTCVSKPKYHDEFIACYRTWFNECELNDIPVFFFTGDKKYGESSIMSDKIIYLENIMDDYNSATDKQWLGYKYMYDNIDADFYCILGTDNYVWPNKIKLILEKYTHCGPIMISGYQQSRYINMKCITFPFGGSGIFLSKSAITKIYSKLHEFKNEWFTKICNNDDLKPACDVAMAYYCEIYKIPMVREYPFYPISWFYTFQETSMIDVGEMNFDTMAICHFMNPKWMRLCHRYKNNPLDYILLNKKTLQILDDSLYEHGKRSKIILIKSQPTNKVFYNIIKGMIDNLDDNIKIDIYNFKLDDNYKAEIIKHNIPYEYVENDSKDYDLILE